MAYRYGGIVDSSTFVARAIWARRSATVLIGTPGSLLCRRGDTAGLAQPGLKIEGDDRLVGRQGRRDVDPLMDERDIGDVVSRDAIGDIGARGPGELGRVRHQPDRHDVLQVG